MISKLQVLPVVDIGNGKYYAGKSEPNNITIRLACYENKMLVKFLHMRFYSQCVTGL